MLDYQLAEDQSRDQTEHAAENQAMLHRLALNLLKRDKATKRGHKGKQLYPGGDRACLLRWLAF